MENLIGKIIDILLTNPLTVTLVLSGVVCVFIAIIGEIPRVQGQKPISGSRAVALASFGVLLIFSAIGLSWILAKSSPFDKPTTVVVVTAIPQPSVATASIPSVIAAPSSLSQVPPPTTSGSQPTSARKQLIGLWEYHGKRSPMPNPASEGQVIVANGDIDNGGGCHIKVFTAGQKIEGLGDGTFQLWLVVGNTDQVEVTISEIQNGAAKDAGQDCPRLS